MLGILGRKQPELHPLIDVFRKSNYLALAEEIEDKLKQTAASAEHIHVLQTHKPEKQTQVAQASTSIPESSASASSEKIPPVQTSRVGTCDLTAESGVDLTDLVLPEITDAGERENLVILNASALQKCSGSEKFPSDFPMCISSWRYLGNGASLDKFFAIIANNPSISYSAFIVISGDVINMVSSLWL